MADQFDQEAQNIVDMHLCGDCNAIRLEIAAALRATAEAARREGVADRERFRHALWRICDFDWPDGATDEEALDHVCEVAREALDTPASTDPAPAPTLTEDIVALRAATPPGMAEAYLADKAAEAAEDEIAALKEAVVEMALAHHKEHPSGWNGTTYEALHEACATYIAAQSKESAS